jgi:hypothetical protein
MPHDKNGEVLAVGDRVTVLCEVKTIYLTEEFCNVTLETVEPMFPGDNRCGVTLNAKQVVKVPA